MQPTKTSFFFASASEKTILVIFFVNVHILFNRGEERVFLMDILVSGHNQREK